MHRKVKMKLLLLDQLEKKHIKFFPYELVDIVHKDLKVTRLTAKHYVEEMIIWELVKVDGLYLVNNINEYKRSD
jgi:hypothetical protein